MHDGREYRYFIAAMSDAESGNPESVEQDYQRMESYNRQEWCELVVQAVATVEINGIRQTVHSGGVGGVESDADEGHIAEIESDEKADLMAILAELGFGRREIDKAFNLRLSPTPTDVKRTDMAPEPIFPSLLEESVASAAQSGAMFVSDLLAAYRAACNIERPSGLSLGDKALIAYLATQLGSARKVQAALHAL